MLSLSSVNLDLAATPHRQPDQLPVVRVKNMSASWICGTDTQILTNISFELNQQSPLLAIVGPVGAGKVGQFGYRRRVTLAH